MRRLCSGLILGVTLFGPAASAMTVIWADWTSGTSGSGFPRQATGAHQPLRHARRYARFRGARTAGLGTYAGATLP